MKHINRDYSENPYIDPKNTHPSITLDVAIPHTWESISYSNDVSPSFTIKNLLNTDDWSEVLLFVQLHKFEEYV